MTDSQWLFPVSVLEHTPSVESGYTRDRELYDRSRAVELVFRLGVTLQLPSAAMFTAVTWLHRFYMRYALQDYHRQDVAGACIFLATKTEECGRRLRDVAWMCYMKVNGGRDPGQESREVEGTMTSLLQAEEALLEALCFDFVTQGPHSEIVAIAENHKDPAVHENAWALAHDSYRTPLCVLFSARIIAAGCYILAQYLVDGPHSLSLDARLSETPPSASLPTPPTHKAASPDASRLAIDYWRLSNDDLKEVSEAVTILLEYYSSHDLSRQEHLQAVATLQPPRFSASRPRVYTIPFSQLAPPNAEAPPRTAIEHTRTPSSMHGDSSPVTALQTKEWKALEPVSDSATKESLKEPLDLS